MEPHTKRISKAYMRLVEERRRDCYLPGRCHRIWFPSRDLPVQSCKHYIKQFEDVLCNLSRRHLQQHILPDSDSTAQAADPSQSCNRQVTHQRSQTHGRVNTLAVLNSTHACTSTYIRQLLVQTQYKGGYWVDSVRSWQSRCESDIPMQTYSCKCRLPNCAMI